MKIVKMIGAYLTALLVLVFSTGCVWFTYHYEFNQPVENIVSIDICRYDPDNETAPITVICTMDKAFIKPFIADITAMDSYKYFGDFSHTFYGIVVCITYEDGEGEILSWRLTARVDQNGEQWVRLDNFDKKNFYSILLKYIEPTLVPEIEEYIQP